MANRLEKFPTDHWGADNSTSVQFEPAAVLPPRNLITACFVFPIYQNQIVLCKDSRGWGLPGGHREAEETPEDCIRREALEEAEIRLGDITLIGQWVAIKIFDSPFNQKYPQIGYQLLYFAQVTSLLPFKSNHETTERTLVTKEGLRKLHHNYSAIEDIMHFISKNYTDIK